MDQRDQAVTNLSSLIGVSVVTQSNGNYNVYVGNGQPLVVGNSQYGLQTVTSPADPSPMRARTARRKPPRTRPISMTTRSPAAPAAA